jgi:hypothetical protein
MYVVPPEHSTKLDRTPTFSNREATLTSVLEVILMSLGYISLKGPLLIQKSSQNLGLTPLPTFFIQKKKASFTFISPCQK